MPLFTRRHHRFRIAKYSSRPESWTTFSISLERRRQRGKMRPYRAGPLHKRSRMPPNVAVVVFGGFIVWLFVAHRGRSEALSPALWIPLAWAFILGSRPEIGRAHV